MRKIPRKVWRFVCYSMAVVGITFICVSEGMTAPVDSSPTTNDNGSRATNCRSAGGVVGESGDRLTCTLRDDAGKQCSISCQNGGTCVSSGAGCDEFGGAGALDRRQPTGPSGKKNPLKPRVFEGKPRQMPKDLK